MHAKPRPTPAFALAAGLLAAGIAPWPWGWARDVRDAAATRERDRPPGDEAGYYEGLLRPGRADGRDEIALKLWGKPPATVDFHSLRVTRYLPGDILQFELQPAAERTVLERTFTSNADGLRDRDYPHRPAPGTRRIALLGASIDMGWGVGDGETYESRLEAWLDAQARRRGPGRRVEVINFAMAAYSPHQRLTTLRRKVLPRRPDAVLFSATLLDPRLTTLHLTKAIEDPGPEGLDPIVRLAVERAGLTASDLRLDRDGRLAHTQKVHARLRPVLWSVIDEVVGAAAAECRAAGVPIVGLLVPRAGDSDTPRTRGADAARYAAIFAHHAIPLVDLTNEFDGYDPAALEIAPWDDHPNARGHELLFEGLARAAGSDRELNELLLGPPPAVAADSPPDPHARTRR